MGKSPSNWKKKVKWKTSFCLNILLKNNLVIFISAHILGPKERSPGSKLSSKGIVKH